MEQLIWGLIEVFGGIAAAVVLAYWIGYEHGKDEAQFDEDLLALKRKGP